MERILCGIETEYGLAIEGRGAADQIDDSMTLVRGYPGERLAFKWDYSLESPRADLRGFRLDHLASDPEDARFDEGRPMRPSDQVRSDLALPNGARLYNDHGHPEYATQECWSIQEVAIADKAGEVAVLRACAAFEEQSGQAARVYKNNTDFHGASYGTHESYQVPRDLGFERLFRSVLPMLVCRQVLTGAGKAGSETSEPCAFQMSQRADFFAEPANAETLFRRPIFNTRDEPHANPREWIRLHVISGDANMLAQCTARKMGLVKLALMLEQEEQSPIWRLSNPVNVFRHISRGIDEEGRVDLEGAGWTTPRHILESYLDAADRVFDLEPELVDLVDDCRELLELRFTSPELFARSVDWAAKRKILDDFRQSEGMAWTDPMMQALDLNYCDVDPARGLFFALADGGLVDEQPDKASVLARLESACEPTRALARGVAAQKFGENIISLSWSSIKFSTPDGPVEVYLDPTRMYSEEIVDVETVEDFILLLQRP